MTNYFEQWAGNSVLLSEAEVSSSVSVVSWQGCAPTTGCKAETPGHPSGDHLLPVSFLFPICVFLLQDFNDINNHNDNFFPKSCLFVIILYC